MIRPTALLLLALSACKKDDDDDTDATPVDTDATDTDVTDPVTTDREAIDCEVAIVGGGAGGLHTAFRLAPTVGSGVCLFEKEAELGGRIHDIPFDETDPNSGRVGAGARRVMETQDVLFNLADELGMTLQTPEPAADLINARGDFSFAKDDFLPLYNMTPDDDPDVDMETWLYEELMSGPGRARIDDYGDFRGYIRGSVGFEEFNFLHDMSRFRADFEAPLSARGYMDYLDEEWNVCCEAQYPEGGMSRFIVGMQAEAEASGARIFTSDPVSEIRREGAGYTLMTAGHKVTAAKVVIAVPPAGLEWIEGDVVDDIKAQDEYQDIIGIRVVTITQWWPESWWDAVQTPDGTPIWRAWTTEHCLTFIEIPQEPYAAAQHVTRSVYTDDLDCVQMWESLAADGDEAVEAEIHRGLDHLFNGNGVTANVTIPDPLKTHVQVWPAAWHWLRAGADETNADVFAWAANPLPGDEVVLVGEAYNPNRSGWSDAAYKSSINALNTRYGMDLDGLE